MTERRLLLPEHASAEQLVVYLATHVLGRGWAVTFGHVDTSRSAERLDAQRPADPAWRMCWGGLFDEAQTGDVEALLDRILSHTEAVEAAGRTSVPAENVEAWLGSQRMSDDRGDISLLVCSKVIRTHD